MKINKSLKPPPSQGIDLREKKTKPEVASLKEEGAMFFETNHLEWGKVGSGGKAGVPVIRGK